MNSKRFSFVLLRILLGAGLGFGTIFFLTNAIGPVAGPEGIAIFFIGAFVAGVSIIQWGWLLGVFLWAIWNVFVLTTLGFMGMHMHQVTFWSSLHTLLEFIYTNELLLEFLRDMIFNLVGAILGGVAGVSVGRRVKRFFAKTAPSE